MTNLLDQKLKSSIDALFEKYDADDSWKLDSEEIKNLVLDAFKQLGVKRMIQDEDIKRFIQAVDKNNDCKITKM